MEENVESPKEDVSLSVGLVSSPFSASSQSSYLLEDSFKV